MNSDFDRLPREIDARLAELEPYLVAPVPRSKLIARIKAAMSVESRRLARRRRQMLVLRPLLGVAAAALLLIALYVPYHAGSSPSLIALSGGSETAFEDWVDALGESGDQFARLLESGWLLDGLGPGGDEDGEGLNPLDSLEESFESFEELVGA